MDVVGFLQAVVADGLMLIWIICGVLSLSALMNPVRQLV